MNDFDGLLAPDYGLKPQGKSAPMAAPPPKGSSNLSNATSLNFDFGSRSVRSSDSVFGSSAARKNRDTGSFDDLFSGTGSEPTRADAPFDLDSMYKGSSNDFPSRSANSPSPPPVYDKPVYDDDVFDGLPGLKSTANVKFENVFASPKTEGGAFDDLLGGFGKESKGLGRKGSEKDDKGVSDFDDLLAGFGNSRPSSERYILTVCILVLVTEILFQLALFSSRVPCFAYYASKYIQCFYSSLFFSYTLVNFLERDA